MYWALTLSLDSTSHLFFCCCCSLYRLHIFHTHSYLIVAVTLWDPERLKTGRLTVIMELAGSLIQELGTKPLHAPTEIPTEPETENTSTETQRTAPVGNQFPHHSHQERDLHPSLLLPPPHSCGIHFSFIITSPTSPTIISHREKHLGNIKAL